MTFTVAIGINPGTRFVAITTAVHWLAVVGSLWKGRKGGFGKRWENTAEQAASNAEELFLTTQDDQFTYFEVFISVAFPKGKWNIEAYQACLDVKNDWNGTSILRYTDMFCLMTKMQGLP